MNRIEQKDRDRAVLGSLALLAEVNWLDWLFGYDSSFFVFYFVPVAICSCYLGRRATLAIALLCGSCWSMVDWLSGHHYANVWLRYLDGFTYILAFAIVGLLVQRLRQSLRRSERALEEARISSEEVRKLQSRHQVVCAWTKRIEVDGEWLSLEMFLARKFNVEITHGISPEALAQMKSSLKKSRAASPTFQEAGSH